VDVVDLLYPVELLQGHGVEAPHLTDAGEGRLETAQRLQGGVGAHVLVVVEQRHAVAVLDRDDGLGEVARAPGLGGALLRLQGERVAVLAGEALGGGDEVGRDALRHEVGVVGGLRVHRPGAAVGAHRHAAHALDAAADRQIRLAREHLLRGGVHRLQARRAVAVELHAGGAVVPAGVEGCGLGDAPSPVRRWV